MPVEKSREVTVAAKQTAVAKAKLVSEVDMLLEQLDVVEQHKLFYKLLVAGGMPIAPFGKNYEKFKDFLSVNNVVAERPILSKPIRPEIASTLVQRPIWEGLPGMIAGGKKEMHLHLEGKTYLLNKIQSESFIKQFAPNLEADLKKINAIEF